MIYKGSYGTSVTVDFSYTRSNPNVLNYYVKVDDEEYVCLGNVKYSAVDLKLGKTYNNL
ncbi:MAG: hypothetical protein R2771_12040 [Saprospiraceae bacterium]